MSSDNNENIKIPEFHALDYASLVVVIAASIIIGLYYSICKKDITAEGYLFGNRKLKVIPVAFSIMASVTSCMTFVAYPAEVYLVGSDFWYMPIAVLMADLAVCYFYAPVFFNSKSTTLNEYLEKRFSRSIRILCSVIYTIQNILLNPVQMCISSLTLAQVSGINFHIVNLVSGLITTFYTAIGGIRAVVWTDVLQAIFMYLGIITLAVKGTMDVGGFSTVWSINYENNRILPPIYSLDLTERYSIWAWIFGVSVQWLSFRAVNQGTVQRISSLPSLKSAKSCLMITAIGSLIFKAMPMYIGLLLFAVYKDCDPLRNHKISSRDQMVPLLVTHTLKNSPGLPGLVIAALMSATISTISTNLNSTTAIVLNDFYKLFIKKDVSENTASIVMKSTVVIIGVVSSFSVIGVKEMGSLLQVFFLFFGILNGPILGIFTIGMFLPRIKSKAALIGSICGLVFVAWISIGSHIARSSGQIPVETKPIFVHGCEGNVTVASSATTPTEEVFVLYKISYLWHTTIGFLITILTSWILSLFMENNDVSSMDPSLYSPLIHTTNIPQKAKETNETEIPLMNYKRDE